MLEYNFLYTKTMFAETTLFRCIFITKGYYIIIISYKKYVVYIH